MIAAQADIRLKRVIRNAYENVPFYRRLMDEAGVDPYAVLGRSDLPRLPLVDKSMIIEAGRELCDPQVLGRPELLQMRTSGTSGRVVQVHRTQEETGIVRNAVLRQPIWLGVRHWHRTLMLGSTWLRDHRGILVNKFIPTRFIEPLMPVEEQVAVLKEYQPHLLIGQTGGIFLLARELIRRGEHYPLRWIVPVGATLMPHMRASMIEAFGAEPCDMYGAIELGPISWQCTNQEYHVDADRIIVEIVDDAGQPVPPGTPGQVVCTSLHAFSMPFIRYRLQDISALATRRCDCRCRFPIMEQVSGRTNDFLPTPAGDLVSPHFFSQIFNGVAKYPIKEWRVIQESVSKLVYEFVPEDDSNPADLERGINEIRKRFGRECEVRSRRVADIPLTPAGKRRCIHSHLRSVRTGWSDAWTEGMDLKTQFESTFGTATPSVGGTNGRSAAHPQKESPIGTPA